MEARTITLLFLATLVGCSTEDSPLTSIPANDDEHHVLYVELSTPLLTLTTNVFDLTPTGATVSFLCDSVSTNFHYLPIDGGGGDWTFTGTVPSYCGTPTLLNLKFTRDDSPSAGARTVAQGTGFVADPLGGASYKLDGTTFAVDYWGDSGSPSTSVTVDHDSRFSNVSFAFTAGHDCPPSSGTLTLSGTMDRFTVSMPHDSANTPSSTTGSGDAGFLSPATVNATTIDYLFTFETLAPENDYSVTVEAIWPDAPNPDAFCGGTLDFRLESRHFSLYER